MGAESVVKAAVVYDVSQMKEGVAETIEGLQEMAEQATVTSTTMMSKSQAMAAAAQEAATKITVGDLEMAKSARALTEAKAAQAKMSRDVKLGIVDETAGLVLQAEAIATTRAAQLQLVASQKAVAAEAVAAAEAANLSSIGWVAAFQRIAISARESLGAVQEKLVATAETAKLSSNGMMAGFSALGELMGAVMIVGFAAHFIEEAAAVEVELGHLSVQAGISAHDLGGLRLIVQEAKGDFDAFGNGLIKMNKALADSGTPSKALIAALGGIGLKVQDLKGLKPEEQLEKISTAFKNTENTGNRSAAAIALFGKGGKALTPILVEQGAALQDNIKKLADQAGVTDEGVQAARQYTKAMADIGAICQRTAQNGLLSIVRAARDLWGIFEMGGVVVVAVGEIIGRVFESIYRSGVPVAKLLYDISTLNFAGAKQDVQDFAHAWTDSFSKGFAYVKEGWHETMSQFAAPAKIGDVVGAAGGKPGDDDGDGDGDGGGNGGGHGKGGHGKKSGAGAGVLQGGNATTSAPAEMPTIPPDLSGVVNAYVKAGEEEVRANDQTQRQMLEAFRSSREEEIRLAGEKYSDLEHDTAFEVQQKRMTEAQRLAILRKALADEMDAKLSAIAALEAVDNGDPAKLQQDENKKLEIVRNYNRQVVLLNQQGTSGKTDIATPYLAAFNKINTGWQKVQNDLIAGNKRVGQDFRSLGLQLAQDAAKHMEEVLANQVRMEIRKLVAKVQANQAGVVADKAAAAQSDGISLLSAIKQAGHAAKVAAAKAFKAYADVPPVPVVGALAAAATYAAVLTYAAFEKGGVVGGQPGMAVPILAHSGERVLTSSQTTNFERMVNNNSSGGGTMNNYFGGNRYSGAGGDFKSQWSAHEKHITTSLKRMHREGKLQMA